MRTIKDIVIKYMDDHSQEIRNASTKLMVYIKNTKFNLFSNNTIKQALNEQKLKKIENLCNSEKKSENNKNKSNPKLALISSSNNNSICTSEILGDKKNQN